MSGAPGSGHGLSILIPVFNEEGIVAKIVQRIRETAFPIPAEMIIVDDHSSDRTFDIIKRLEQVRGELPMQVIRNRVNRGKGASIRQALKHATGEFVVVQDGDMEYDPGEIPALLRPIVAGEAQVVYGSRFLRRGWPTGMAWPNYLANRMLTWLTNCLYGLRLTDMETCYKVLRRDLLRQIRVRANRFEFEPEVTAKLARRGFQIHEHPISYRGRSRREGKKIKAIDFFMALWTLLRCRVLRFQGQRVGRGRDDGFGGGPVAQSKAARRTARYAGNEFAVLVHAKNYYRWILEQFRPFAGPRLIEVGAGVGTFSRFLLQLDNVSELTLVEPAPNLAPRLRRRFAAERRVRMCDSLEERIAQHLQADSCVAVNVLEHVSDDQAMLAAIYQLLRPGGRCLLFVPALPWLYGSLDAVFGHQRRYTARSLRRVVAAAGFRRIRIRYFNCPGVVTWFIASKLLRQRRIRPEWVRVYDRYVVPLAASIERRWPPPIGQSLVAIARKPTADSRQDFS